MDALDAAARPFYARAEAEEAAGRYGSAASFYRLVIEHDPRFVPATLGLGRSLEAQHDLAGAEQVYRAGPADPEVLSALATLVEALRPEEALSLWRQLQSARFGDPIPYQHEARLLAPSNPLAALAAWSNYTALLQGAEPDGETFLAVVDALIPVDPAAAEAQLRDSLEHFPDGSANIGVRERLDRLEIEAAAALVDLGGDSPLPATLVPRLVQLEEDLAAGRVDHAVELGRDMAARAASSAVAHGAYSDALIAAGRWSEAEISARIARRLAPDTAEHRLRLGRLLAEAYGGRKNAEAVAELRDAARLLPGDVALRFQLGVLEQSVGEFDSALDSFRAVIDREPGGVFWADASKRVSALERLPPALPLAPLPNAPTTAEGERQWRLATVLLQRGRRDEAVAALDAAMLAEPSNTRFLNLRAGLDVEAGDFRSALARWRLSLSIDPDQPGLWKNIAEQASSEPERSAALREAARLGDADAHYLLAEIARGVGDWTTVRQELLAYTASAGRDSQYREAARSLESEAKGRQRGIVAVGALGSAVALSVPLGLWWRRRSGRTLAEVLAAAPAIWHDAARILSAIRHEVIKHNTTVLPDVAEAVALGNLEPWQTLAPRLPALVELAQGYVDSLVSTARAQGQSLVPERDPVLGPLLSTLRRLARLRRPDAAGLRAASAVLNGEVYDALSKIVRDICVLAVDTSVVAQIYERVASEPGFENGEIPPLDVSGGPLSLRMFRADLDDVLANLLRNALFAGARSLAVEMHEAEDEITGHPLAEIAVVDDAPGALTNAMIRSRFIGRGLGLAVDLVNRHGGAIRVEPRGEGKKAVVVQFRSVEGQGEVDAHSAG